MKKYLLLISTLFISVFTIPAQDAKLTKAVTEYTVKKGDTFYDIANRNNVSWESLEEANPSIDIENLGLNQNIIIPNRINRSTETPETPETLETSVVEKIVVETTIVVEENKPFILHKQDKSNTINYINIESGINFSKFVSDSRIETAFKNGNYSPSQHQAVLAGINLKGNLFLVLGAAFDKHQVMGEFIDMSNSHLSYDLNYMSLSAGLEFPFLTQKKVSLLASVGMSYSYLFSGFQDMGAVTYDLGYTDFQKTSFMYSLGPVLLYQMTDAIDIYLKNEWSNTMYIKERESATEGYSISYYTCSLGLRFNLTN